MGRIPNATLPSGNGWRHELEPYYEFLERFLPVPNAPMGFGPFDTNNAITLVGAKNFAGLVQGDPDANLSDYLPYNNGNPYLPMYDASTV